MGRVYATGADYLEWAGEAGPADITRRLARASDAVAQATVRAVYDVDTDGYPTAVDVVAAMRDATCAQARWWIATGDELGDGERWQSVGIGRVQMSRASRGSAPAGGARTSAGDDLAPQAHTILYLAGLVGGEPLT